MHPTPTSSVLQNIISANYPGPASDIMACKPANLALEKERQSPQGSIKSWMLYRAKTAIAMPPNSASVLPVKAVAPLVELGDEVDDVLEGPEVAVRLTVV